MVTWRIKLGWDYLACGHDNILCVQGISVVMGGIKLGWDYQPCHEDITTSCVFRGSQW